MSLIFEYPAGSVSNKSTFLKVTSRIGLEMTCMLLSRTGLDWIGHMDWIELDWIGLVTWIGLDLKITCMLLSRSFPPE